jgi:hypothetical protein
MERSDGGEDVSNFNRLWKRADGRGAFPAIGPLKLRTKQDMAPFE